MPAPSALIFSRLEFIARALPVFHHEREVWRRRVYQSAGYRRALTQDLKRQIRPEDHETVVLQVGAYADGPAAYGTTPVITYQDSLAAEYWDSPFVPAALRANHKLREQHLAFEKKVASSAARILASSEYMRRSFIENYGIPEERVINAGIGMNVTPPAEKPARDFSRNVFLFIGKEFYRKGGEMLVAAFARLQAEKADTELHIIGPVSAPPEIQGIPRPSFPRLSQPKKRC